MMMEDHRKQVIASKPRALVKIRMRLQLKVKVRLGLCPASFPHLQPHNLSIETVGQTDNA